MDKKKIKELFYVEPKAFHSKIESYYKDDKNVKALAEELGEMLNKIANGLSYRSNFINYTYRDEMVGDALVKMFAALKFKKYKLDRGGCSFGYFTSIAWNAFVNRIKKEKKHHETINEYREQKYEEMLTTGKINIYVKPTIDSLEETNYFEQ